MRPPQSNEDKAAWCRYGEALENEFVRVLTRHGVPAMINPEKRRSPYAPDLIVEHQVADLKVQTTPFLTAANYGMRPRTTVTINRKDVERYARYYPGLDIWVWVDWHIGEPLRGIYRTSYAALVSMLPYAPEHQYLRRFGDQRGNARSSYLVDVAQMERYIVGESVPRALV